MLKRISDVTIKTHAGALAAALKLVALPEQKASRTPALGVVRFAANGGFLCVSATGFAATITTSIEAEGEIAVPLERLAGLAKNFPAGTEVTISADDSTVIVVAGQSRSEFPLFPIVDLPARHELGEETGRVELDVKVARELFTRPAFAVSSEETRYYLGGIFLHNVGDDLVAVATDSYRLCRITTPAATTLSSDRSLIVPRAMLKPIGRLLGKATGNVTLRRSERLFTIEGAGWTLVTRLIDGSFPDYERLLAGEAPNAVTVDRAGLREFLDRFAAATDPRRRTHGIALRWAAFGLHLSAPDGGEDCLAAEIEGEGETAAQVRYLIDLTSAMRGDSVRFAVGGPGSQIVVTDPDDATFTALQMPIHLRQGKEMTE